MTTDTINTILAIIGIVLGGLSLVWQVFTYFHTRRKEREDSKEKITATMRAVEGPNVQGDYFLLVDVVNIGNIGVHIKTVELCWTANGVVHHANLLMPREAAGKAGIADREILPPRKSQAWVNQYGKTYNELKNISLSSLTTSQVWIAVNSHLGEVARINGEIVLPLLIDWHTKTANKKIVPQYLAK